MIKICGVDYIWYSNPGMNIHVSWHLAEALLSLGGIEESIKVYYDLRALSPGNHAEQDLDAVNYCLRLFLSAPPRPEFMQEHQILACNWAPSIYNSLSYFNDAHAAIAFFLGGERSLLTELLNRPALVIFDRKTQEAGEKILRAIHDFAKENYTSALEYFEKSRSDWYRIGGSRAQREVFDVLVHAAHILKDQKRGCSVVFSS